MDEALTLAQELSLPYSLAYALDFAVCLYQFRREPHTTQEQAEETMRLSTEQGFALQLATATILRGWAVGQQGQEETAALQIRQGIADYRSIGAELCHSYHLALLAEVHGKVGRPEAGLTVLAEALAFVDKTGERYCEAELCRLKGELLLLNDEPRMMNAERQTLGAKSLQHSAEAEACFRQAIEVARGQRAKSLELRAAISLVCLWQKQGKNTEGHQLLSEIYCWFTEGLDTPDLIQAKKLLEELS
jgi:predicted ATPase